MSVAILGAGILGACTALELADRGYFVTLFERNADPLLEASRHNEGKLHLGFVYAGDATFQTALRMIRGASQFMDILGRWVPGATLCQAVAQPFDYVVHRETMITTPEIERHFARVADALGQVLPSRPAAPSVDPSRPAFRRLDQQELTSRYDPNLIEAAYETCEIAVDAWKIADDLGVALSTHPRITLITRAKVIRAEDRTDGRFDIVFDAQGERRTGPFRSVVNALWANRPVVDRRYGLPHPHPWYIRRKLGVNLLCRRQPQALPSFTVVLGPFGDVVAYPSGRVYLSWYPSCRIGATSGDEETDWDAILRSVDLVRVKRDTVDALAQIAGSVRQIEENDISEIVVNGGSIFALGRTDIDDPSSQLHERLDAGAEGRDGYLSVDTAKYTLGPAVAVQTADRVSTLLGPCR